MSVVLIRSFGNDTECKNTEQLRNALSKNYKNMSVSIVSTQPSGIKNISWVDVQSDGSLIETHSKKVLELKSFYNK